MFKKILIANRGEIAVRIINTAREMGIKTVAVYSDFDRYSLYTKLADEAYHIGESPASQSYLLADRIIAVAVKSGAEAIHPGYGFLSERAVFARACAAANIKFIGPPHTAIDDLGSKTKAKQLAIKNNIPVVEGTNSAVQDIDEAKSIAKKIGFPVMIKASAGGGGKGMRVVRAEEELEASIRMAQNEARSSFGDESVFIEKYVDSPKHIEFQVLADEHGNAVHLGERECSMQRRHQKIIEETPCSIMDDDLRFRMGECAKKIVLAAGYTNAGTVEFMLDKDRNFYFLEVNTRLQVEHPITEMRTGLDLVAQQLKIASGEKLSFTQDDVKFNGAAIECRICAEDPDNNFMPSIGKLKYISRNLGNGMREDTGIEQGNEISIYYDSMITKLISYGPDRKSAIDKMERALRNYTVIGVKTNISFLLNLLKCPEYFDGNYNTQFVEKIFLPRLAETKETLSIELENAMAIASALFKEKGEHTVKVKTGKNGNAKNSWLRRKELH
ncbi:MAG: acetyl-CoA carboxylase biotin carboxylase subunit [Ignavibacteriota bacterium]|nr:acetyl-CoA carboxylase biotin carboxylase subunit [Ignavibacteriota bacterium]